MKRKTLLMGSFLMMLALAITAVIPAFTPTTFANTEQTFIVSVDNTGSFPYSGSGAFNTPAAASGPGPLLPDEAYEFTFYAAPEENVSFATMFVQSNDWFFAPNELGIPIYNADGSANSGDVTRYVTLWDAGTEGDEPVGSGTNQAPRQSGPDTGPDDPNDAIRQVLSADVPPTNELIRATLSSIGPNRFKLRLDNVSGSSATPTPFAPGAFVVHSNAAPLFVNGRPDYSHGLEAIAEDGNPRSGDVTNIVTLYDAGAEVNEAPGYGLNQAPRQTGPNAGASENGVVSPVSGMASGNIHVTITPVD